MYDDDDGNIRLDCAQYAISRENAFAHVVDNDNVAQ
jgi:hypothetical protein